MSLIGSGDMLKSINRRVPVLCAKGIKRQRVERKQHECFRGDLPKHRKFDRHRKTGTEKQASKKQASKNCDRGGGVIAEQILKMENDRAAPEAILFQ